MNSDAFVECFMIFLFSLCFWLTCGIRAHGWL